MSISSCAALAHSRRRRAFRSPDQEVHSPRLTEAQTQGFPGIREPSGNRRRRLPSAAVTRGARDAEAAPSPPQIVATAPRPNIAASALTAPLPQTDTLGRERRARPSRSSIRARTSRCATTFAIPIARCSTRCAGPALVHGRRARGDRCGEPARAELRALPRAQGRALPRAAARRARAHSGRSRSPRGRRRGRAPRAHRLGAARARGSSARSRPGSRRGPTSRSSAS